MRIRNFSKIFLCRNFNLWNWKWSISPNESVEMFVEFFSYLSYLLWFLEILKLKKLLGEKWEIGWSDLSLRSTHCLIWTVVVKYAQISLELVDLSCDFSFLLAIPLNHPPIPQGKLWELFDVMWNMLLS